MEKKALQETPRLQILNQILNMEPKIVNLNQTNDFDFLYPRKILKKHQRYCAFWRMDEIEHTYDGKFEENILVVGRAAYGKTTFVQNLGKKNCLETYPKFPGCLKLFFQRKEKTLSESLII